MAGGVPREARGGGPLPSPRTGTVTFIQRFGSALNLNVHFHTVALDGVFCEGPDGKLHFTKLPAPSDDDVVRLLRTIRKRIRRLLHRRDLFDDDAPDPLADEHPLLASLYSGSVQGRRALGTQRGRGAVRLGSDPDAAPVERRSRRHAHVQGFDLHADLAIRRSRRDRLETLLRYCARPPIASERLAELPDSRYSLRLKSPWSDGTTHFVFQPDELLERLCSLIPRPQVNLVLYHGVLAPNSKLRRRITKHGRDTLPREQRTPSPATRAAARKWAALMQRAFAIDVLACPRCAGRLRLIAVILDRRAVRRILAHLALPAEPPPITPARAPPALFDTVYSDPVHDDPVHDDIYDEPA